MKIFFLVGGGGGFLIKIPLEKKNTRGLGPFFFFFLKTGGFFKKKKAPIAKNY